MKKNFLIFIFSIFVISCSNNQTILDKNSKNNKNKIVELSTDKNFSNEDKKIEVVKKIKSNYQIFEKLNLPEPYDNFGNKVDYLISVDENKTNKQYKIFENYDEKKVLSFYKDLNLRSIGDNSFYFRWKTEIDKDELFNLIRQRIPIIYKANKKNVLTLSNNEWKSLNVNSVSKVKNVKIAARGESGIITHILVETSSNKYLIVKEYNIRKLLASNNELFVAKGGMENYRDKAYIKEVSFLPSASFAIEDKNGEIIIYGSGYGHGVGMPQFSAYDLASRGYSYKNILSTYYKNSEIVDMKQIIGNHDTVKVALTCRGTLEHKNVKFKSNKDIYIKAKNFNQKINKYKVVEVKSKNNRLDIFVDNKKILSTTYFNVSTDNGMLTLLDFPKSHTNNPSYRGTFTINSVGSKFRIINNVNIEDYLLQVVPSEMPYSFGVEALKTQAVAARTYAISDYLKNKYTKLGFHVKDTVESQVYNNQKENEFARQAIEETKGEILIYNGKPIDAKYFSTSSGLTNNAHEVW